MKARRTWNAHGWRYTTRLTPYLTDTEQRVRYQTALLLGGTRDDRAALALNGRLRKEPLLDVRLAMYSGLGELGFYTDYHARLILEEHKRRWSSSPLYVAGRGRAETTAELLCFIFHPEARHTQDELDSGELLDGGVAEIAHLLLDLRDHALRH